MFWPLKGHHQVLGVKIIYSYKMNNSIADSYLLLTFSTTGAITQPSWLIVHHIIHSINFLPPKRRLRVHRRPPTAELVFMDISMSIYPCTHGKKYTENNLSLWQHSSVWTSYWWYTSVILILQMYILYVWLWLTCSCGGCIHFNMQF
jgi:hypothetical protein